jgi:hypothetical protein
MPVVVNTDKLSAAVSGAEAGAASVEAFIANIQALNAEAVKAAVTTAMAERDATDDTVNTAVQGALDAVEARVTAISAGLAASIPAGPTPSGRR